MLQLLLLWSFLVTLASGLSYWEDDPEVFECQIRLRKKKLLPEDKPLRAFHGWLGHGYDFLTEEYLEPVFAVTFSDCRLMNGILVQDSSWPVNVMKTTVDIKASVYDNIDDYNSHNNQHYGADVQGSKGDLDVAGSGSYSSFEKRSNFAKNKAIMRRTGITHTNFELSFGAPWPSLSKSFQSKLEQIRDMNDDWSRYFAEVLVRDYGTHVIKSETAGSSVFREKFEDETEFHENEASGYNMTLGLSAAKTTNESTITTNLQIQHVEMEEKAKMNHNQALKDTIRTIGGPDLRYMTSDNIFDHMKDNLASLRQTTMPIYAAIQTTTLPHWHMTEVMRVGELVREIVDLYISENTHLGCLDPNNNRFDPGANKMNWSQCGASLPKTKLFGGVFTRNFFTCSIPNYLTKKCSCPMEYHEVILYFAKLKYWVWCQQNDNANPSRGLLFGGFASADLFNPHTSTTSDSQVSLHSVSNALTVRCPLHFEAVPMGDNHVYICISPSTNLYETAAMPFERFNGCGNIAKGCSDGFEEFLMDGNHECALSVCAAMKSVDPNDQLRSYKFNRPNRPPYTDPLTLEPFNIQD